jgi:hypothetical protein
MLQAVKEKAQGTFFLQELSFIITKWKRKFKLKIKNATSVDLFNF